jgi:hypothetical protein
MNLSSKPARISFHEKSAWISLGVILVVFIPYFLNVFRLFASRSLNAGAVMGLFIAATIFTIILQVVLHIACTIFSPPEVTDERDRAIELKSFRVAYGILAVSLFLWVGAIVMLALPWKGFPNEAWLGPVFLSQVGFLCFVLAEVGKYFTQAVCYRRGA